MALGTWGIVWQQVTGQVNAELLAVYVGLLGTPAVAALVSMIRGTGTGSPQSSSPDPPPPSGRASASGTSPGGGEACRPGR
jgi:hypothetical protein